MKFKKSDASSRIFIHELRNGAPAQITTVQTHSDSESETLEDLEYDDSGEEGWSREETDQWITGRLDEVAKVFRAGDRSERIKSASQWLLDSHSGTNELLSFVQATVCLEILLGDKAASEVVGLGELLRNRCAYLIAESHQDREQVMKQFSEIYSVRSKIVHAGKNRLSRSERGMLSRLRAICRRVIRAEVKMLES